MSVDAGSGLWQGSPLPRGRHRLTPETVNDSQRTRLLRAMLELVGTNGFERTSVPQVVAAAHVAPRTFYKFFTDKTDCFLALCDEAVDELRRRLIEADDGGDWTAAIDRGVDAYLAWFPEQPLLTRAYLVELPRAGARADEQRDRTYQTFQVPLAELARRARVDDPTLPPLRPSALAAAVVTPTELIAAEVRAGRLDEIGALHDDLTHLLVRLLADDVTANALHLGR